MLSVVSLTSFAPVRSAFAQQTGTDVQAQIQALLAQIAALQSHIATINNTSCYTFTRDLSMGSRGDDVRALQVFLNNKGYLVAMTGAGSEGNETTTFGSLTRTALARYQTGVGIAPAVGYFGPTTRAHVHSTCTPTTPPPPPLTTPQTTTPTTTTPPRGDEGQLKNFSTISTEPDVKEGEENMRILGIEFYADDSDMRVDRVDVEFEKADGSGSNRLNRYVESLSLRLGSREIASQGVSSASRKDDVYSFRFTGLNTTVSEGGTTELYVVVDTVQNIDSADENTRWTVRIPARGIRATDEANITETYAGSDLGEIVAFGEATQGALRLTASDDNTEDGIVVADEDSETKNVTLLSFDLRGRNQDITIDRLPVSLSIAGNAMQADEIVRTVKLMQGSRTLKTKNIPSNVGLYEEVVFDNLDLMIDKDSTETFKVVADIRKLSGNFSEGDSVTASTTVSLSGWDIEDERGDSVEPTGSVSGGTLYFFTSGISTRVVEDSAQVQRARIAGNADSVDFTIRFRVKAIGDDDIYLDGDVVQGIILPTVTTGGLSWATTTDSTTGTDSYTALVVPEGGYRTDDVNNAGDKRFRIKAGTERTFSFVVNIPTGDQNASLGVRITGLKWDTINQGDMSHLYDFNLGSFATDIVTGLRII